MVIIIGLGCGAVIGGIYYINQTGMNAEWRGKIAHELENIGIIADFDNLRIDPTRGLIAEGVNVYTDSSRKDVLAHLEHLVIDVDKTKIMRGKVRVNKVSLKKANITLPIDPDDPDSPIVTINELQGDIYMPDKSTVVASDISGKVSGIQLELDARVWRKQKPPEEEKPDEEKDPSQLKTIARFIQKLQKWHWSKDSPPILMINLEGDIDDPQTARIDFSLLASDLERENVALHDVKITGDYKNNLITLDTIRLSDDAGSINAQADFLTAARSGRFTANSTLHLQALMRKVFGINILQEFTFSTPPDIECQGNIHFDEHSQPHLQITGTIETKDFSLLGSSFTSLTSDFSAKHGDFFFNGIHLQHPQGQLSGRVLLKDDIIRYEADSTLPPSVYSAFLKNSPINKVLNNAEFHNDAKIHLVAKGTMNRSDITEWSASGNAKFDNFSYKGVPMHNLSGTYFMSRLLSKFTKVSASLDYTNYWLRKRHGGPLSARASVDAITIDRTKNTVNLNNIRTTAWPAPIVQLFVPNVAKHIETYRFHRPPNLVASGTFGLKKGDPRTNFKIDVSSPGNMNYDFLGKPTTLRRLKGRVRIKSDRVEVTNLTCSTFQGPTKGKVTVFISGAKKNQYTGEFQWSRLHLKDIGKLYDFEKAEQGLVTGRLDFSGQANNLRKFNGKGTIALERGNLFAVPMLGPLSPLIGGVLGKRNPTQQQAEDASCNYVIKNGVLHSNNFLATTRSLKFTGEGKIDLATKDIDLLIRMNARGLFSVLSLPLRPFLGLFQFQGNGYIKNAKWRAVVFTNPARGKDDPIFKKPPKAKVLRE